MKVAIIGSRELTDYEAWKPMLLSAINGIEVSEIVSGGAKGVDSMASRYASESGIPLVEFTPDYQRYGRCAPLLRNSQIVEYADMVIAFPSGESRGTMDAVRKAQRAGKSVVLIDPQ